MTLNLNLDPFAGMCTKQPELVEVATSSVDKLVKAAYEDFVKFYHISIVKDTFEIGSSELLASKTVMEPMQIEMLLQMIREGPIWNEEANRPSRSYSIWDMGGSWPIGYYLSNLIQTSYDAGHNSFELHTDDSRIDYLGLNLKGREKYDPIKIGIYGIAGDFCGIGTRFTSFDITGDVGIRCCLSTENSRFNLKGQVGDECGEGAKDSEFITYDVFSFTKVFYHLESYSRGGNTVVHLDKNGNEVLRIEIG